MTTEHHEETTRMVPATALRALRARHELTPAWAAERVRVSLGTWLRWERDGLPRADLAAFELLCLVLDDAIGLQLVDETAVAAPRVLVDALNAQADDDENGATDTVSSDPDDPTDVR